MQDFESKIMGEKNMTADKIDMSILKFFWHIGPFGASNRDNLPRFLRKLEVLKNFSDNELRILNKYLHVRKFSSDEIIFKQGNPGIGFYIILSGHVDVRVERDSNDFEDPSSSNYVISLEKGDYFGELALLQEKSIRNASVYAKDEVMLLGLFRPDVDDMINVHPIIAAKLLQSISMIIANRLFSVTQEFRVLKHRLLQFEKSKDENATI